MTVGGYSLSYRCAGVIYCCYKYAIAQRVFKTVKLTAFKIESQVMLDAFFFRADMTFL